MDLVYLYASTWNDLRESFWGCGQRCHQEVFVVRNHSLLSQTSRFQTCRECLSWALAQRGMGRGVVDFENVFTESFFECAESPYSLALRVDELRHLTHVTGDLRIAAQVMNKLRVGGAK